MSTYRTTVALLAGLTAVLGVVMLVIGLSGGGGEGLLIGVLFIAAGVGRLYLLRRKR